MPNISRANSVGLVTGFQGVSIAATVTRFCIQRNKRRQWLDGGIILAAAAASTVGYAVLIITMWCSPDFKETRPDFRTFSRLGLLGFQTAALWGARISIAIFIVSFSQDTFKPVAKAITMSFVFIWLALCMQHVVACTAIDAQLDSICRVPRAVRYFKLGYLLGDGWLILAPILIFRTQPLDPHLQLIVVSLFACNFFTMIATMIHTFYALDPTSGDLGAVTGQIQATVSITVSNVLIILPWIRRWLERKGQPTQAVDYIVPSQRQHHGHGVYPTTGNDERENNPLALP